ncbi:MAG: flagellar biosynthetic protein FliP, partial [Rhodospirillaceae bacterium]|nr:flagellar biosynthetic protein FliP [Rhodospirillaceae bacterium]
MTRRLALPVIIGLLVLAVPDVAFPQTLSLDMGEGGGSSTARIIQLILLM